MGPKQRRTRRTKQRRTKQRRTRRTKQRRTKRTKNTRQTACRSQGYISTPPPGPPGAGAERVPAGRTQQRFAHPDDDYVPPERGEPQIQPVSLRDPLPEPESLTDQPPPLPPPASLVVAKSPPPPAAATAPGSLPAGALVPNKRSACRRTENVQGGQPQQGDLFSRPPRRPYKSSRERVVCANFT
jgi:hypothetical protein